MSHLDAAQVEYNEYDSQITYPELYGQPEEKGIRRLLFPRDEEEEEKKELLLINDKLT